MQVAPGCGGRSQVMSARFDLLGILHSRLRLPFAEPSFSLEEIGPIRSHSAATISDLDGLVDPASGEKLEALNVNVQLASPSRDCFRWREMCLLW
jgi:hypothetical protein